MIESEYIAMIEKLSRDYIWDCFTRSALQIRWTELTADSVGIIYCDIDKMHDLNTLYGHDGVDKKIKSVIGKIRKNDIIASRWLNGDELIFIAKSGDVKLFAKRILKELNRVGISATFSYSYKVGKSPEKTINPLDNKVQKSKNAGNRGIILD